MASEYSMEELWTIRMPQFRDLGIGNIVDLGPRYFFLINDFSLYTWDRSHLAHLYSAPHCSSLLSCVKCIGGCVYLGTTAGDLWVFDCEGSRPRSRLKLGCGSISALEDFGKHIAVGTSSGSCIFIDERASPSLSGSDSQSEWITNIAFNDAYFYCIGTLGHLYPKDLRTTRVRDKPLLFSGSRNNARFNRASEKILNYIDSRGSLCEFDYSSHRSRDLFRCTSRVADMHMGSPCSFIVTADRGGGLVFFRSQSYKRTFAMDGLHEGLTYSCVSSDGSMLFTSSHLLRLSAIDGSKEAEDRGFIEPELRIR
jgi:hypothetical protein